MFTGTVSRFWFVQSRIKEAAMIMSHLAWPDSRCPPDLETSMTRPGQLDWPGNMRGRPRHITSGQLAPRLGGWTRTIIENKHDHNYSVTYKYKCLMLRSWDFYSFVADFTLFRVKLSSKRIINDYLKDS